MPHDLDLPYAPNRLLEHAYKEAFSEGQPDLTPNFTYLQGIEDQYEDMELIGTGALKEVYKCYDTRTKRYVALARLKGEIEKELYDVFIHEAWLISALKHPNIIKIHELGIHENGRPFYTMDLKGNTTLEKFVLEGADLRRKLECFLKICDAMSYAHSKNILHLDLKPQNIQCDRFGEVLVCDWGLGKYANSQDSLEEISSHYLYNSNFQTLYGEIKGSPGYMAPEQIDLQGEKDHRTDVFSLGAILHFILTSQPPFTGKTEEVFKKTKKGLTSSLKHAFPSHQIPKSLDAIARKALATEQDRRYSSVEALRDEIQRYLQGHSTRAEKPSLLRKASLFIYRHKVRSALTLLFLIITTLISLIYEKSTRTLENKADTLTTKMELLGSEYHGLELSHYKQKEELTLLFTMLSYKLVDKYYQENPDQLHREIQFLLNNSGRLDRNSPEAQKLMCEAHCIKMNFSEAAKIPLPESAHVVRGYQELAKQFPSYQYNALSRPSIAELTAFLQKAHSFSERNQHLVTCIIQYDRYSRPHEEDYTPVIIAALPFYDFRHEVESEYDAETSSLSLSSKTGIFSVNEAINFNIFSYLRVNSLTLKQSETFDLSDLNQATIKKLDISGIPVALGTAPAFINGLEELHLSKKCQDDAYFRRAITSDVEYEIIRH